MLMYEMVSIGMTGMNFRAVAMSATGSHDEFAVKFVAV